MPDASLFPTVPLTEEEINGPEIWRPWPRDPHYQISTHGRVRRVCSLTPAPMPMPQATESGRWVRAWVWVPSGGDLGDADCTDTVPVTIRMAQEGYVGFAVTPSDAWRRNQAHLHRAMAETFLPRLEGQVVVRHLNDNKLDNSLTNLAWGTVKDNIHDYFRNGKRARKKPPTYKGRCCGERHRSAKLSNAGIIEIRRRHAMGVTNTALAKAFGVAQNTVSEICSHKTWKHIP